MSHGPDSLPDSRPDSRPDSLPGILADIARLAGIGAAARIAQARGGGRSYIPAPGTLREGHWLVQAMGLGPARELARLHAGVVVDIPLGPFGGARNALQAAIRRGLEAGKSVRQVALEHGVTERTVYNLKAAAGPRADQHRLPF